MIGFLLGSGFSKAIHKQMPVMVELLDLLERAGKIPDYVPNAVRTDLERTLSYLWTNYPWHTEIEALRNRAAYLTLVRDLHYILSECEFTAWNEIYKHNNFNIHDTWQGDLARILMHSDCAVLTMNYDTLRERLMLAVVPQKWLTYPAPLQRLNNIWSQQREPAVWGGGGFGFKPNLFKLHGSLSWYSLDPLDSSSSIYGLDMDEFFIRPQDPLPDNFDEALQPVIVPPVADKSSLYTNRVLRSQWTGALHSLRQCYELYCIGYSFPSSDLSVQLFLAQACGKVHTVHIVNKHWDTDMQSRIEVCSRGQSSLIALSWVTQALKI